jgi:isocitrate dehydrogenase (NAD+)
MLSAMGYQRFSNLIETAVIDVYEEGKVLTPDVGGTATTEQFTNRVIQEIEFLNETNFRYSGHINKN